jgi:hypothetical protein
MDVRAAKTMIEAMVREDVHPHRMFIATGEWAHTQRKRARLAMIVKGSFNLLPPTVPCETQQGESHV